MSPLKECFLRVDCVEWEWARKGTLRLKVRYNWIRAYIVWCCLYTILRSLWHTTSKPNCFILDIEKDPWRLAFVEEAGLGWISKVDKAAWYLDLFGPRNRAVCPTLCLTSSARSGMILSNQAVSCHCHGRDVSPSLDGLEAGNLHVWKESEWPCRSAGCLDN